MHRIPGKGAQRGGETPVKKRIVCAGLTLCFFLLFQPQIKTDVKNAVSGAVREWLGSGTQTDGQPEQEAPTFEQQLGVEQDRSVMDVTLYFRFADTGVLGAATAQLDMRREETVASSLVQRLIDGPDIAHDRLSGVFPQGTQLLSVTGDGATAFVTLNRAFLGKPDGAPSDWEDLAVWQEEAALRRRLAVQSIVLALTEEGRYQRVQLYVADNDDDVPERIPMYWFDPSSGDASMMLAACPRDESVLLTPRLAMDMILSAWKAQDWQALYPLLARTQEDEMPTLSVFESQMYGLGVSLLDYTVSDGTVSTDGQSATIVLDASIRSEEGGDALIERESVPLVRDADNWAIRLPTLMSLMIRE